MSYEENLKSLSMNADNTLGIFTGVPGQPGSAIPNSGKQYCAVKITGKNQVGLAVAGGDNCYGILENKPQEPGAAATVGYEGISNARAGGAVSAGAEVVPDATGRFVAGVGTGRGRRFFAVEPAAGADEMFACQIV